jgi:hypothetical protein
MYVHRSFLMDSGGSSAEQPLLPPASPLATERFQISGLFLFPGVASALGPTSACWDCLLGFDLVQNGHQVLLESHGVLAHREVTNLFHDDALRPLDLLSRLVGTA